MTKIISPLILSFFLLAGSPLAAERETTYSDEQFEQLLADYQKDIEMFQLWNNCYAIGLVVENLDNDAKNIGLTGERIQTMIESRLRGARIYTSMDDVYASVDEDYGAYLYVRVRYLDGGLIGGVFGISLNYDTLVHRNWRGDNGVETNFATTWDAISIGHTNTIGQSVGQSGFIMQHLSEMTDSFINEYLRVNADTCD